MVSITIIGSGPCGLGAAYRLHELNSTGQSSVQWRCVDSSASAGGLASTLTDPQGFLWDIGGHVVFSHYHYFSALLERLIPPEGWNSLVREAWVRMRDTWIPYPFQQNIHRLPKEDLLKCLHGLVEKEQKAHLVSPPTNFRDWLLQSFGPGLCDVFMFPYNFKVWAYEPHQMNVQWMGERVATVDLKRVLTNVIEQKDELGWGPNNVFTFPKHGGTGAIWTALWNKLPSECFRFNRTVNEIDVLAKVITYSDGHSEPYDRIVSTMPLDQLIGTIRGWRYSADDIKAAQAKFRYSSTHIVGIGLCGRHSPELATKCWMYFPESSSPFYRCTVFSNYSKYHCPKPDEQWSLMCEISESACKPVLEDPDQLIQSTIDGLIASGLISAEQAQSTIVSKFHTRLEYGYPTPFLGRDQLVDQFQGDLEQFSIYSRGRFGTWKYEVSNQDHSFMQGVEAVDRILFDSEEMTKNYPGLVNRYSAANQKIKREPKV